MKKVFGVLILLFLFVGISLATNGQEKVKIEPTVITGSMSSNIIITHTDFVMVDKTENVLNFIYDWVIYNYSTESDKPTAGLLDNISIDNETNTIQFYTTDNFNIKYVLKPYNNGEKLTLYIYCESEGNPSKYNNKKIDTIRKQFRKDFYNWIYKLE